MDQGFLIKLKEITETNMGNPKFGVNELSKEMGMSRSSLFRKLRSYKGQSINQYIRETRLIRALEIIQKEDVTIAEAANRTGFGSAAYFNACFHEYFGYPPGKVRKAGNKNGETVEKIIDVKEVKADKGVKGADGPVRVNGNIGTWVKAVSTVFGVTVTAFFFINLYWNSRVEKTIAVLPFRNLSNDTTEQWFCDGCRAALINNLSNIGNFTVRSSRSSDRYRETGKSVKTIGKELNTNYLIDGSFGRENNKIKFWVQVIDAKKDKNIWVSDTIRTTEGEWLDFQSDLARTIADTLNVVLSPAEIKRIEKKPTENEEAYKYYLQGLYFADRKRGYTMNIPVEYFQKAIDLDPRFALAYAGIAKAKIYQIRSIPDFSEEPLKACKTAIDHALEIDPDLPAAHIALGSFYWQNLDYKKALQEFEFVNKTNPNDAEALYNIGAISRLTGDWRRAVNCLEKAIRLDPLNAPYIYELGRTYRHMRDYARAEEQFNRAIQMEPSYWMSFHGLVDVTLLGKGDTRKAREILENAVRLNPVCMGNVYDKARFLYQRVLIDLYEGKYADALDQISQIEYNRVSIPPPYDFLFQPKFWYFSIIYRLMDKPESERSYYDSTRIFIEQRLPARAREDSKVISALGIAYAGLGNAEKAIELGKKAINMLPVSKNAYVGPYLCEGLAIICMMTGKYTESLKILDEVLSMPGPLNTLILEMDPRWAPLKKLPGFKKLLKKYPVQYSPPGHPD